MVIVDVTGEFQQARHESFRRFLRRLAVSLGYPPVRLLGV